MKRIKPLDDGYADGLARLLAGAPPVSSQEQEQAAPPAEKLLVQKIRQAISEHPDWKNYKLAKELGVSPHTIKKYRKY
jgi:hypothetical protein